MESDLTKRTSQLYLKLREVDGSKRSAADNNLLDTLLLIEELCRKVDRLSEDS